MAQPSETRESLIRRLPNADDAEAWDAFVEIYVPLLFRLGGKRGLQQADAEDFVQEVLSAVARSVDRWVEAEDRGKFRAWLFRIASNLAINFLTRPKHRRLGVGGSNVASFLEQQRDPSCDESAAFALEYRREVFRWAAEQVRETVTERVWLAFWRTSVDDRPVAEVAEELGTSVGSVYVARSRVSKRIRTVVQRHEEQST